MATYNKTLTFTHQSVGGASVPVSTTLYTVPANRFAEVTFANGTGAGNVGIYNINNVLLENINLNGGYLNVNTDGGASHTRSTRIFRLGAGMYLKTNTGGMANVEVHVIEWLSANA